MPGPLLIGIEGPELDARAHATLRHPATGGVVLFTRNYRSPQQLQELTAAVHALREPPLLIAVDQEGGPVQRFREGFTRLPPAAWIGHVHDQDPSQGERLAQLAGWVMAAELRACGVDLSFAPVLDLGRGVSQVIGERALHRDPAVVARLAKAWLHGMGHAGMAAVGKHYPGHGGVAADSHITLPTDPRPLEELAASDLLPFQRLAAAGLPGMMAAHVVYPEVDDRPAGFSRRWLEGILRRRIGFTGAVLSDDLGMHGAATAGTLVQRVATALWAGCDGALVCEPELAAQALARMQATADRPADRARSLRLARLHRRLAPGWEALQASSAYWSAVETLKAGVPGLGPFVDR
ncbi:MAG: beta-N-acetylhexosaminidase [Halorhodospira sp.]